MTSSPARMSTSRTRTTATAIPRCRSGASGRAMPRYRSARAAGSAPALSSCRARASAGTWWWRPARWSVARSPATAWSRAFRPGLSANMPREMAGHGLHLSPTERFPCAISAVLPTWTWPPSTWAGGFGKARPPPGRGIAARPHGARGSQRGHVQARDDLVATAAYQPEPAAAAAARRFVRDTLRTWQVVGRSASQDELVDDAVLLTSELVTNAVVHAGTPVQVTCRLAHGAVEVVVLDRHPVQLVPDREPRDSSGAERTSGRGLMLPAELASSWGVT